MAHDSTGLPVSTSLARFRRARRGLHALCAALAGALAVALALNAYSNAFGELPASDECNFLHESCSIAEEGGLIGFLSNCFRGAYPFDNRTPGLPLLGSFIAERSLNAVHPFRALQAVLAALAVGLVYFGAARAASPRAGLAAATLCAACMPWTHLAAKIAAEPLIYALTFVAWLLLSGAWRPRTHAFWAGLAVGAAYLFKATITVLLAAWVLAWIVDRAWQRWRKTPEPPAAVWRERLRALGLFVLGALVLAWPVLINNTLRYGSPLHNRNAQFFWLPYYDARLLDDGSAGPLRFIEEQGVGEIFARLGDGLALQAGTLLSLFGGSSAPWALLAPLVLVLAGVGLLTDRRRFRKLFALFFVLLVVILFAWWAKFTSILRFTAVLTPLLAWYAVQGAAFGLRRTRAALLRRERHKLRFALAFVLALAATALLARGVRGTGVRSPWEPLEAPPKFAYLRDWLLENPVHRRRVTLVTSYMRPHYDLLWLLPQPYAIHLVPPYETWSEFEGFARERGARYLLIELHSWREREPLLRPYFRREANGWPNFDLPGWRPVAADPHPPGPDYLMFERVQP